MGVVKTRRANRKPGLLGLGRRFVSFKTNNCDRHFTVHEDLLCANSKYFKDKLHKDRKAVEGECSICSEELDPKVDDITFCRAECGQNIHEKCMEAWKRSQGTRQATCPTCRKAWKQKTDDVILVDEDLDRDAVQLYIDWLYSGKLHIYADMDRADEEFDVQLLKAWVVSSKLIDFAFRYAIIAKYVATVESEARDGFWIVAAKFAFEEKDISSMKQFVVDAFLMRVDNNRFENNASDFPTTFVHAICGTLLHLMKIGMGSHESHKDFLVRYTQGHYKLGDSEDEVEESADE
ncbi:Nn.00g049500.m01.CDS01 [Neocucurbitaria sp. VM-36]